MNAKAIDPILNVSDFRQSVEWFQELGWEAGWHWGDPPWPPTNHPWNVREMHVRHPDGHVVRISKAL